MIGLLFLRLYHPHVSWNHRETAACSQRVTTASSSSTLPSQKILLLCGPQTSQLSIWTLQMFLIKLVNALAIREPVCSTFDVCSKRFIDSADVPDTSQVRNDKPQEAKLFSFVFFQTGYSSTIFNATSEYTVLLF